MPRDLAGGFRLGDDVQEVVSFCIAQQMLEVSGKPELNTAFGLLSMGFKGIG